MSEFIEIFNRFIKIIKEEDDDLVTKYLEYLKNEKDDYEILLNKKRFEDDDDIEIDPIIEEYKKSNGFIDRTDYVVLLKEKKPKSKYIHLNFVINKYDYTKSFKKCIPTVEIFDSGKLFLEHNFYDPFYINFVEDSS